MTLYKGQHVALRSTGPFSLFGETRLVHVVADANAPNVFGVVMLCNVNTLREIAMQNITDAPLSCVWCIAGRRRFFDVGHAR